MCSCQQRKKCSQLIMVHLPSKQFTVRSAQTYHFLFSLEKSFRLPVNRHFSVWPLKPHSRNERRVRCCQTDATVQARRHSLFVSCNGALLLPTDDVCVCFMLRKFHEITEKGLLQTSAVIPYRVTKTN